MSRSVSVLAGALLLAGCAPALQEATPTDPSRHPASVQAREAEPPRMTTPLVADAYVAPVQDPLGATPPAAPAEAKPTAGPISGSSPGMETMDHSKMGHGMGAPKGPAKSSKASPSSSSGTGAMDHSKMGHEMGAPKPMGLSTSGTQRDQPKGKPSGQLKAETAIDPVCGMEVDKKSAQQTNYEGQTYYFCSAGDKERFVKETKKY